MVRHEMAEIEQRAVRVVALELTRPGIVRLVAQQLQDAGKALEEIARDLGRELVLPLGDGARAHMLETGMITPDEFAELSRAGAVGEVLGHFLGADGRPVDAPLNQRALSLELEDLRGKEVVAIAGGHGKARAIAAVLSSGVVTGLITDEATARRIVDRDAEDPAGSGPAPLRAS